MYKDGMKILLKLTWESFIRHGKRTIENVKCFSINSIADIKNLTDEFKNKKILITGASVV